MVVLDLGGFIFRLHPGRTENGLRGVKSDRNEQAGIGP